MNNAKNRLVVNISYSPVPAVVKVSAAYRDPVIRTGISRNDRFSVFMQTTSCTTNGTAATAKPMRKLKM